MLKNFPQDNFVVQSQ